MAINFVPRGDLASPQNIGSTKTATWPQPQLGKKVSTENDGGGINMNKGISAGKKSDKEFSPITKLKQY